MASSLRSKALPKLSLIEKVCLVKWYFQLAGDALEVVGLYEGAFSLQIKGLPDLIRDLVSTFEETGSVLKDFHYDSIPLVLPEELKSEPDEDGVFDTGEQNIIIPELLYKSEIEVPVQAGVPDTEIPGAPDLSRDQEPAGQPDECPAPSEITRKKRKLASSKTPKKKTCEICHKSFFSNYIRAHRELHVTERAFACTTCNKSFTTKRYLKEHTALHSLIKPFICEVCGKVSSCKSNHNSHMLIHSTEKRHSCHFCGMKFVRRQGLKRHIRTHTNEKPYTCSVCGQSFSAFMTHQMHVRTHTGERPFKCHHCDKTFIGQPSLNAHLKQHVGEYVHLCPYCDKRFKFEQYLKVHIEKKHTGQVDS